MPLVLPSPLMPLALMTAWIWSRSASAADRRLTTTVPTPSPSTKPSAEASNEAQRPRGDSMPDLPFQMCICGVIISAMPPATAISQSPPRIAWQARCSATSEDEQAVSMAIVGPCRFRK